MSFKIIGTGRCLPEKVITNDDLINFLDTSDEWIYTHTGVRERHIMTGESLLDLAVGASAAAISDAGICADEIDIIIVSTLRGDYVSPSVSCLLAGRLGINPKYIIDSNMACPGFIYALDIADSYFRAGKIKRALVLSVEGMTRMVDWSDRANCILFGDASGAVVLEAGNSLLGIKFHLKSSCEYINIPVQEGNSPFRENQNPSSNLYMNGQEVYKFAVSAITSEIPSLLSEIGLLPEDIDYYLFHQANIRIIESARRKLKLDAAKFPHNLERYGNTSSACIPMLIDELNKDKKLKKGDKLLLCAFGAGLVTATCVIEWDRERSTL